MSSEVKANKISPATGTAFTFGDSGDTFTVPSGATITNSGTASGFGASGKVNQVVSVFKADTFSTTSTSMTDVTGISAAITPSASDSKVLITVSMAIAGAGGYLYSLRLKRVLNSVTTYPGVGTAAGSRTPSFHSSNNPASTQSYNVSFTFLDSPASTLESTYNVQCMVEGSTFYVGRSFTDTDSALYGRMGSSITLTEILA